ncbi:uncharacterized protein [Onthophagus taurus]|uniref:uncharacterized protein n=1 Tax=Onthophagus taurus TaxID=166361 RepID=UPI0039BDBC11
MSRKAHGSQPHSSTYPAQYQIPIDYPIPHTYKHHHKNNGHYQTSNYRQRIHKKYNEPETPIESCFSDETISCFEEDEYEIPPPNHFDSRLAEYTFSDVSDSSRIQVGQQQYYEEIASRRQSVYNNTLSEGSKTNSYFGSRDDRGYFAGSSVKEQRKFYPVQGSVCETCYDVERGDVNVNLPKPIIARTLSERPQSSQCSSVTSAVIHACGGKCQTCENVCYYFLQVAFVMGILIGVSLSIAGSVLRKSAARNLQVLIYIGSLCAMVCLLLLCIQCRSKRSSKRRKNPPKTTLNRSPIPLETLNVPTLSWNQSQLNQHNQINQINQQHQPLMSEIDRNQPQYVRRSNQNDSIEEPGIPWWRRKDIIDNR